VSAQLYLEVSFLAKTYFFLDKLFASCDLGSEALFQFKTLLAVPSGAPVSHCPSADPTHSQQSS
jgi:hypothetical protein